MTTTMMAAPPTVSDLPVLCEDLIARINGLQPAIRDLTTARPGLDRAAQDAATRSAQRAVDLLWQGVRELGLAAELAKKRCG